jgi:hypothetical protein
VATPARDAATCLALTELSERQREHALDRYRRLRPHLEQNCAARGCCPNDASLPLRTGSIALECDQAALLRAAPTAESDAALDGRAAGASRVFNRELEGLVW